MKKNYNVPATEIVTLVSGNIMQIPAVSPGVPDPNGNEGVNSGLPIPENP